jgi:hypothetical protein
MIRWTRIMDAKSDEIGAYFGWIDCFFLSIIYNIETAGGIEI